MAQKRHNNGTGPGLSVRKLQDKEFTDALTEKSLKDSREAPYWVMDSSELWKALEDRATWESLEEEIEAAVREDLERYGQEQAQTPESGEN